MSALDRRYDTQIHRRVTRTVMVGDVAIGSEHPVVVVLPDICVFCLSRGARSATPRSTATSRRVGGDWVTRRRVGFLPQGGARAPV